MGHMGEAHRPCLSLCERVEVQVVAHIHAVLAFRSSWVVVPEAVDIDRIVGHFGGLEVVLVGVDIGRLVAYFCSPGVALVAVDNVQTFCLFLS